jgi:antirestriction protein ArdC
MRNEQFVKQADIYERVTLQIVEAIEAGAAAYKMPWHITGKDAFSPVNAVSKRPYRGVNVLSLWVAAERRGYASGLWATYKQWGELGAQVRRGEKSTLIVFWKVSEREDVSENVREDDEPERGRVFLAKGYPVFNVAQVEGYTPPVVPELSESERIQAAERFFAALGADIRHGGNEAFYEPERDFIQLPRFEAFREGAGYYSTLAHESTHWTGAESRLNRDIKNRFGSSAYAAEELIAELGAAFLCSALKMSNKPRADHAAYIANWLELLRRDKRAIFAAASKAQQAVDWMQSRQNESAESSAEAIG